MEAHCPPGRINISEAVAREVSPFFELESRGSIEVKHERVHRMYFLNRPRPEFSRDQDGQIIDRIPAQLTQSVFA